MHTESNRQKKFSKQIQKELSKVLDRMFPVNEGVMVTVSVVRSSPDLRICKVYLSAFPADKRAGIVDRIKDEQAAVRKALAYEIRNVVRFVPELHYFEDDTLDYADKINNLLSNLDIPKEEEE